jgi:hypothetical protein
MKTLLQSLALAGGLAASPAFALTLGTSDPVNDFLPSYTGAHNADLDVLSAYGIYDASAQEFTFGATLAGTIGTTTQGAYVWGINRGAGTQRFVTGTPSIGAGISFDAVILVNANGTGLVNLFSGPAVNLAASAITIQNSTVSVVVPVSMLPSTGLAATAYQWNFWPRNQAITGNAAISDFAPNASTVGLLSVSPVPEPQVALTMAAGLGLIGAVAGRKRPKGRKA